MAEIDKNASVHDVTFVVFDFETTGTNPDTDQIVEVGAVAFTTSGIEKEFSTLIKPTIPIPKEAVTIHGITDKDVQKSPGIEQGIQPLVDMLRGSVGVAHNIQFDFRFLNNSLSRIGIPVFQNMPLIDTLELARKSIKSPNGYKLRSIAGHLGIVPGSAHRALDDAHTCRQVMLRCIDTMMILGDMPLSDVLV